MRISDISNRLSPQPLQSTEVQRQEKGRYARLTEQDEQRTRAQSPQAREEALDVRERPNPGGLSLYYSHDIARRAQQQYQQDRERLSRIPPHYTKAVQSYQQLALQERREQVSRLMGLDVYA